MGEHFHKVFNHDASVDWEYVEDMPKNKLLNALEIY